MKTRHFIAATAGHVDHGKSALVKALTGTDPDRLPEEKAREITIDLGFAHLELPSPEQPSGISLSLIDVPGHEDFVRNMIAGLGSIDLALLVVAADDGWMPQTEEHLQILNYLGVARMVVAVNKSDITPPDKTIQQVKEQLRDTPFADAPIVSVSARSGIGISELKQTLARILEHAASQPDSGKARLLIDRVFNLPGVGSVVTGTLAGGKIDAGQTVYIQPGNFKTRVRSLQSHRSAIDTAEPGMRVGANLTEVPKSSTGNELRRGFVLTAESFEPHTTLDVFLQRSARMKSGDSAARPLKSGTSVYLHYGTARTEALVILARDEPLEPGSSAVAQLRLSSPIVAFTGDRFVVRDRSEQHTIAGGVVLDVNDTAKSFRTQEQQNLLGARAGAGRDIAIWVESELSRRGPTRAPSLLNNSGFSTSEVGATLAELEKSGRAIIRGEIASDLKSWEALRQRAISAIEKSHRTNSQQEGLELTQLRAVIPVQSSDVKDALIEDLCATGFVRKGSVIAQKSHRARLPAELKKIADQILSMLAQTPLDPPGRLRLAADVGHRQALRFLIEQGQVVELGTDVVITTEAFAAAKEVVTDTIARSGSATVSELREALHTSRRVAVPLLERLDRDRITRRLGDRRVLASHPVGTTASG